MKTSSLIANADVNLVVGDRPEEQRSITQTAGKNLNGLMITLGSIVMAISWAAPSAHAQDIRPVTAQSMAYQREQQALPDNVITVQVLGVRNIRVANNGDPRAIVGQAQQDANSNFRHTTAIGALAGAVGGMFISAKERGYNGHSYNSSYKRTRNMGLGALLGAGVGAFIGSSHGQQEVQQASNQANDSVGRIQADDYLTTMRVAQQVHDQYGVRTEVFQITVPYTTARPGDRLQLIQGADGRYTPYNVESPAQSNYRRPGGY